LEQDNHIYLAWGQIGISESTSSEATPSPISETLIRKIQAASLESGKPACFKISLDSETFIHPTTTTLKPSESSLREIGVLLCDDLNTTESWQTFLTELEIPKTELLVSGSQVSTDSLGGSAAGNLLWILESLSQTYSRTKELIQVFHSLFSVDC
jgi:hypothetical protein